ncbi:transforming growth factor-induced protein (and secreted protein MPB70) [Nitritalea halalkaliphila LW7]|uniref:Transforming growth factor-induced protein (And secreted protein MPB70) n=2 Tax=Nitritalea TaxID=1187887 RepID=I5C2W2_9BACT|nr:transforming growth factor-induced protein (and secreted protein MPB70) [Nitritalea halalkaliphila LW7]
MLTVTRSNGNVTVTDNNGNTFNVTTANVAIENGVVHVIDGVLLP